MIHLLQYIAPDYIGIVICIFLICLIGNSKDILGGRSEKRFLSTIWIVLFCCCAESFTIALEWIGHPACNAIDLWINAITVFLYVLVAVQMCYVLDESLEQHRRVISGLCAAYFVFVIIATLNGWLFTVTGTTDYNRGPLLVINMLVPAAAFVLLVRSCYKMSRKFAHIRDGYIALMAFFLCLSTGLQIAFCGILLIWPTMSVMMMLFYIYLKEMQFMIDPVTSIMNRTAFEQRMRKAERAPNVAILVFDLNNLKEVNDANGHAEGDMYLATAAEYISEAFASHGFTFRIGGDEFGTIVYRMPEKEIIHRMTELDLRCMSTRSRYPLSFAHGYAIKDIEDADLRATMKRADDKMYSHKSHMKKIWR